MQIYSAYNQPIRTNHCLIQQNRNNNSLNLQSPQDSFSVSKNHLAFKGQIMGKDELIKYFRDLGVYNHVLDKLTQELERIAQRENYTIALGVRHEFGSKSKAATVSVAISHDITKKTNGGVLTFSKHSVEDLNRDENSLATQFRLLIDGLK